MTPAHPDSDKPTPPRSVSADVRQVSSEGIPPTAGNETGSASAAAPPAEHLQREFPVNVLPGLDADTLRRVQKAARISNWVFGVGLLLTAIYALLTHSWFASALGLILSGALKAVLFIPACPVKDFERYVVDDTTYDRDREPFGPAEVNRMPERDLGEAETPVWISPGTRLYRRTRYRKSSDPQTNKILDAYMQYRTLYPLSIVIVAVAIGGILLWAAGAIGGARGG